VEIKFVIVIVQRFLADHFVLYLNILYF